MAVENWSVDVARSIRDEIVGSVPCLPEVDGHKLWVPYVAYFIGVPIYQTPSIPEDAAESYYQAKEVLDNIPDDWRGFIRKVGEARTRNGCEVPYNLLYSINMVIKENPKVAERCGLEPFPELPSGWGMDTRDEDLIRNKVNGVLADGELSQKLFEISAIEICPEGQDNEIEKIIELFEKLGIRGGDILVDFGCGTGENTVKWQKQTGMDTVGIERQFLGSKFKAWLDKDCKAAFVQRDVREETVIPDNSARVVMLQSVVPNINQESLERVLEEAVRIMEEEKGILVVSPMGNYWDDDGGWLFYVKTKNEQGEWVLERRTIRHLLDGKRE